MKAELKALSVYPIKRNCVNSEMTLAVKQHWDDELYKLPEFRSLVQGLSTPGNGEGGSEQIREGAQISEKPATNAVERFLSMLRFDSKVKVNALGRYIDLAGSKTRI